MQEKYRNLFLLSKYRTELMGIAAVLVMASHFTSLFPGAPLLVGQLSTKGIIGVDMFLLLSGIGLYFSMNRADFSAGAFYRRRISRLLFSYLPVGIPFWIADALILRYGAGRLLENILMISFWTRGTKTVWYLALLLPLYMLAPLIYVFLYGRKTGKTNRAVLCLAVSVLPNLLLILWGNDYYEKTEIAWSRLLIFCLGLILGKAVAEKRRIPAAIYGAGLVLIPVLYLALFLFLPSGMRLSGLLERYAGSLMAIWICLAAVNLLEHVPLAAPGKVCAFLGQRSLECYLVHVMVLHLMNDVSRDRSRYLGLGKSAAAYLVLMALCVLLANLIYRLARFITKKAGKLAQ